MKSFYSNKDIVDIRHMFERRAVEIADNGKDNYILMSGGVDSLTALFAFEAMHIPYKAVNLKFVDIASEDRRLCDRLSDINIEYIDEKVSEDVIRMAVMQCYNVFNKIRAVKCDMLIMLDLMKRHIPVDVNIITGVGGDACVSYSRSDMQLIHCLGQTDKDIIGMRVGDGSVDEFIYAFKDNYAYHEFFDRKIRQKIAEFTTVACNKPKPKAIFVYPFIEYYEKYKCYRKPRPAQKASGLAHYMDNYAIAKGYKNRLAYYKEILSNER